MPRTDWAADQHMSAVSAFANMSAYTEGLPVFGNPWFRLKGCSAWNLPWSYDDNTAPGVVLPIQPNWALWTGEPQTVADMLNQQELTYSWSMTQGEGDYVGYAFRPAWPGAPSTNSLWCIVPQWLLPYVSGRALLADDSSLRHIPPIWPGAVHAELGASVEVTEPITITEDCNGVIATIVSMPTSVSVYDWGDVIQTPRAGYVAFINDSGHTEDPQPVTWPTHIIGPKMCRLASGLYVRPHSGGVLTVQTWTYLAP